MKAPPIVQRLGIRAVIVTVVTVLQIGLLMAVFALMDYSRFFQIDFSLFVDEFMIPLFVALLFLSVFWSLVLKLIT